MEKIPTVDSKPTEIGMMANKVMLAEKATKRSLKSLLNYGGVFIGVFILFAVMVILTTSISPNTDADFTTIGLNFFVLIFASFAMYVSLSDTGMREGLVNPEYIKSKEEHQRIKLKIAEDNMQSYAYDFCEWYIKQDKDSTKKNILASVGIGFTLYNEQYIGKTKKELQQIPSLTKGQIKAIINANEYKGIVLKPNMLFQCGRYSSGSHGLGMSPSERKRLGYVTRLLRITVPAVFMSFIAVSFIVNPTWATFAEATFKTLMVALNGFYGYKFGYEHVVNYTTDYQNDQIDLMNELIRYATEHTEEEGQQ